MCRLVILVVAMISYSAFALDVDCADRGLDWQIQNADIIFIGRAADLDRINENNLYELDVLRRWKGKDEKVVLRDNKRWPIELSSANYYLFFLNHTKLEGLYYRPVCQYLALLEDSGSALLALGEPLWSSEHD